MKLDKYIPCQYALGLLKFEVILCSVNMYHVEALTHL